jgi:HAD superfamily hydrolase (TIGR01549 family)
MFVNTFSPYLDTADPATDRYLRQLHYLSRGSSMETQFEEAINHFSLNLKALELVRLNESLHISHVDQIKTFTAVTDIIKKLKSTGKHVSICTNRQTDSLQKILKNNGLESYFTHIISCTDAGHTKPDPYCLLELIQKSGHPKEEFIYFGDSKTDYEFARNAQIDFIIIDHYLNQKKFYQMIIESFM